MFRTHTQLIGALLVGSLACFSVAQAQTASPADAQNAQSEVPATAHATVSLISDELLAMLGDAKTRFNEDPQAFYADIDAVIAPWIDFDSWTRGVMGEYFGKASEAQLQAFAETFRRSLIETYAKGLINVNDGSYEIDPPREGDEAKISVGVRQKIHSGSEDVDVAYNMVKSDSGRWQIKNALLDGVSLGPVFRSQFKGAMEDSDGDIDVVIQNWGL